MTNEELLVYQLRNPPVMSMALNRDHLYRMMAERMNAAADRIEELLKEREIDHENINLKADFIEAMIGQSAQDHYKLTKAVEFIQEVRRNGDTRLASMAIAVLAELEK